jgi:hypothetical protein
VAQGNLKRKQARRNMKNASRLLQLSVLASVFLAVVGVRAAGADTISFNLDSGNPAVSPYPGPYISVSVNRTDDVTAILTFASLDSVNGLYTYAMGATDMVGASIHANTFTVTGLSEIGGGTPSNNGAGNVNGFGVFNLTIANTDGFGDRATQVMFTVHNTSGTWGSAGDVLAPNANGALAAAHVFVVNGPQGSLCNNAAGAPAACATGFAAGSGGPGTPRDISAVPEPSSLLLLASGLGGVARWARRKYRNV